MPDLTQPNAIRSFQTGMVEREILVSVKPCQYKKGLPELLCVPQAELWFNLLSGVVSRFVPWFCLMFCLLVLSYLPALNFSFTHSSSPRCSLSLVSCLFLCDDSLAQLLLPSSSQMVACRSAMSVGGMAAAARNNSSPCICQVGKQNWE